MSLTQASISLAMRLVVLDAVGLSQAAQAKQEVCRAAADEAAGLMGASFF